MQDHHDDELEACLLKAAEGDREAFETVFRLTQGRYLAMMRQLVGDPETARDIVQQGYVQIWTKASQFDPARGNAFVWMLVIMRRKAIDHLRSARHVREHASDTIDTEIEDVSACADESAAAMLQRRLLGPALMRLPEKLREAVLLHVLQDLSCSEIGERLSIPRNTAKSRVRRGLQALRGTLPFSSLDQAL